VARCEEAVISPRPSGFSISTRCSNEIRDRTEKFRPLEQSERALAWTPRNEALSDSRPKPKSPCGHGQNALAMALLLAGGCMAVRLALGPETWSAASSFLLERGSNVGHRPTPRQTCGNCVRAPTVSYLQNTTLARNAPGGPTRARAGNSAPFN